MVSVLLWAWTNLIVINSKLRRIGEEHALFELNRKLLSIDKLQNCFYSCPSLGSKYHIFEII